MNAGQTDQQAELWKQQNLAKRNRNRELEDRAAPAKALKFYGLDAKDKPADAVVMDSHQAMDLLIVWRQHHPFAKVGEVALYKTDQVAVSFQ
jgi:hypothetical protein